MKLISRTEFSEIYLAEEGEKRIIKKYRMKLGDEARYLQILGGIHTPRLYRSDADSVTMEYIDGNDLGVFLASDGGRRPEDKLRLIQSLASIYSFFHDNGVLHMDPKPSNIFINKNGEIKVIDFQLSTSIEHPVVHLSREGIPYYWYTVRPPESFSGTFKPAIRSEIYTLGHLFYYVLRGRFMCEDFIGPIPEEGAREKLREFHEQVDKVDLPREPVFPGEHAPLTNREKEGEGALRRLIGWMVRRSESERPENMLKVIGRLRSIELGPRPL